MTLSRRAFLAALAATSNATVAHAQRTAAPVDEALFALAGSCILGGSRERMLHPTLASMLGRGALAGIIVGSENVRNLTELRATLDAVRARVGSAAPPALVAADQEGGSVSHLSPMLPRMPSIHELGTLDDVALTERWGAAMGAELRRAGVNLDLAPVLDVRTNPRNMVVHLRTFGARPELVARHARPMVNGLLGAGVLTCVKHFPGHGDTALDSHQGLPRVAHDITRLEAVELVPFREVMALTPAVMLAHVVYAGVDAAYPATLSRAVAHGVLRERLGFRGVTVSDDLEMSAIRSNWGVSAGAVRSMEAGCDLLLIAHSPHIAIETARIMARRAADNDAFRARLEEAAGRVRALRERVLQPVPAGAVTDTAARVMREMARRAPPRRSPQRAVDPTRARPR
jgi:beta-N-acetylhexosaminidase